MRKTNLFKGIVCGLMLTAVVGTSVFAGNYSEEVYGYKNANIRKTYTGSVGIYTATGNQTSAGVIAVNNSGHERFYKTHYGRYHNGMDQYVEFITDSDVVATYSSLQVNGPREYDNVFYSYSLTAYGYNSTAEATGQADFFSFYIEQCDK